MVHPDIVTKSIVSKDVKSGGVQFDVGELFIIKQEFAICEHMFQWVRTDVVKLGFSIVIGRLNSGSDRRHTFVMMRYKRSGNYKEFIWKFKLDGTG